MFRVLRFLALVLGIGTGLLVLGREEKKTRPSSSFFLYACMLGTQKHVLDARRDYDYLGIENK